MGVRVIEENGKLYLDGTNIYDHRQMIAEHGGSFDEDKKMWFFPADKLDVAREVIRAIPDPVYPNNKVIGEAVYKDKSYPVLFEADRGGEKVYKLAFRDGSNSFWVPADKVSGFKPLAEPTTWEQFQQACRPGEKVIGKCEYKERTYSVLHKGEYNGEARMKLAFRDGSKTFWVSADQTSNYQEYQKPIAWEDLKAKIDEVAAEHAAANENAPRRAIAAPGM